MAPLAKVPLKGAAALEHLIATDLTRVLEKQKKQKKRLAFSVFLYQVQSYLDAETLDLVEPQGNGLAVPSERHIERIIERLLHVVIVLFLLLALDRIDLFVVQRIRVRL